MNQLNHFPQQLPVGACGATCRHITSTSAQMIVSSHARVDLRLHVCVCYNARSDVTTGADWASKGPRWTDPPWTKRSDNLLSSRGPKCLRARHFGSRNHQFVSALSAAATIKLKLISLTFNRTAKASNIARACAAVSWTIRRRPG